MHATINLLDYENRCDFYIKRLFNLEHYLLCLKRQEGVINGKGNDNITTIINARITLEIEIISTKGIIGN